MVYLLVIQVGLLTTVAKIREAQVIHCISCDRIVLRNDNPSNQYDCGDDHARNDPFLPCLFLWGVVFKLGGLASIQFTGCGRQRFFWCLLVKQIFWLAWRGHVIAAIWAKYFIFVLRKLFVAAWADGKFLFVFLCLAHQMAPPGSMIAHNEWNVSDI